jgi:hypothetical protein
MEIDKKKGISIDHCHFVFSIPKTLRRYFLYDRSLLSELSPPFLTLPSLFIPVKCFLSFEAL